MNKNNGYHNLDLSRIKNTETAMSMKEAFKDVAPMDWGIPIENRKGRLRGIPGPNKRYFVKIIKDELSGGYVATHPALKGCITSGESELDALLNLEDAKIEWMIAALESGISIPKPDIYRLQSIYKKRNRIRKLNR